MSGPTLLSFHRLNFLRLLRSLGLPCGKTRDVIDASIYKPKFSRKLRETTKITIRNKLLIISEDFYDNLRFQHIQIAQIVDECAEDLRSCNKDNTICSNTVGSFKCFCEPGFIREGHSCRGKILYNEH